MDSQNDKKKLALDLAKLAAREEARLKQPLEEAMTSVLEAYRQSLEQVEVSSGDAASGQLQDLTDDELRTLEYLYTEFTVDELRALLKEISAREKSSGSEDPPA